MPLDSRKLARITSNLIRLRAARTQPVTLTLKASNGATSTMTINAIFRIMEDADPAMNPSHSMPRTISNNTPDLDAVMSVLTTDITYQQLRSCIYVDLPPGSPGVILATRYLIVTIEPKGIPPGADRIVVALTRQR